MNSLQEKPNEDHIRNGGCYDRGAADSYYGRPRAPHYFVAESYASELVEEHDMTQEESIQYSQGYTDNELEGSFKEW
jgi:hypothetical protein